MQLESGNQPKKSRIRIHRSRSGPTPSERDQTIIKEEKQIKRLTDQLALDAAH